MIGILFKKTTFLDLFKFFFHVFDTYSINKEHLEKYPNHFIHFIKRNISCS